MWEDSTQVTVCLELLCTIDLAAPSLNDMTQHRSEVCKTQFSKLDILIVIGKTGEMWGVKH